MEELIQILDGIAKYGLSASVNVKEKEKDLERLLVNLYSAYFNIEFDYDETDYQDFNKSDFPDVIANVKNNFPDFGWYHVMLNTSSILQNAETGTGDAIDDLSDIIYDVLEIKWRIQNNSEADGLWFFQLIFRGHTQQHLIDLLNYMKDKTE